ncbi:hypothetical protein W97_00890 [Coniosporium apollinis CBS 100218]|uniref:CID domain-containing protein n=1 Tax=Coniosporium apollinis (strain CBS 100218) TaxID=1168221 RepID=R7YIR3_CONA1|nr:uncharacterized protein W97_00890 [Coniosporium apollinis CBS 100218]EON61674.1 hypothetical protein W97_00890 [Coniosporium apollinis CBS 100218]
MEELDAQLQSLQTLKPPGVTKTKIESITAICIANVQAEALIIQTILAHFQRTPATHKLGVLYVVDSVTRQWVEKARHAGQALSGSAAAPGTYAAGVHKITEVLPVMMNELIQHAPENQKEKVKKLLDIWERGHTFPATMLADFKQRLEAPSRKIYIFPLSFGFCPKAQQPQLVGTATTTAAPVSQDPGSILASLANMGNQAPASAVPAPYAAQSKGNFTHVTSIQHQNGAPPALQPQSALPYMPQANIPIASTNGNVNGPAVQANAAAVAFQFAENFPGGLPAFVQILQAIQQQNLPPQQEAQLLAMLGFPQGASTVPPALPAMAQPAVGMPSGYTQSAPENGLQVAQDSLASEQNGRHMAHDSHTQRDRSRSPDYSHKRRRVTPPNRRASPTYEHDRRGKGRGRGNRRDHRQRTPPAHLSKPISPANVPRGLQPKWVEFDKSLAPGTIKVLSRTLFIGGVNCPEAEVKAIFSRFGKVQTCIVNPDKHHAFVKMVDRKDAVAAKVGMENSTDPEVVNKARSTRWGVGFGPRECSDYNTGISIIPIDRLTDADLKWVVSAEYGGTGGVPLESGMVMEEPDIEIGAGVSSKAISARMGPEPIHHRGGGSMGRKKHFDPGAPRYRKADKRTSPKADAAIGVPPPVPGFGFQLPGMNR